jgi:hypothetical protein
MGAGASLTTTAYSGGDIGMWARRLGSAVDTIEVNRI